MPNNNDILDDLGFDLPPLPKIKKPADDPDLQGMYESPAAPAPRPAPHHLDKNDILSAPDVPADQINPAALPPLPKVGKTGAAGIDPLADIPELANPSLSAAAAYDDPVPHVERDPLAGLPDIPAPPVSHASADDGLTHIRRSDPLADLPDIPAPVPKSAPAAAAEDDLIPHIKRSDPLADIPETPAPKSAPAAAAEDDFIPHIKRNDPLADIPETPAPKSAPAAAAEDDFIPHIKRNDPLADIPETPAKKKPAQEEQFIGSYEQKNKGNFIIGGDDEEEEDLYDSNLDHIDKGAIQLDEMDTKATKGSKALKQQILMDEMSMELEEMPVIEDLSTEYTTIRERIKSDDISTKTGKLEDKEKQAIKDHLREEINKRPENFNKHASNAMALHLQLEKNIKRAKKGFLYTVGVMFLTLACAGVTYIGLGNSTLENAELYKYLAYGTVAFSLLLMIKSKHLKTLAAVYFIINTLVLAGPGLIMFVLNQQGDPDFNKMVIWFVAAAVLSGVAVFFLSTNETIDAYYTTDSNGKRKK